MRRRVLLLTLIFLLPGCLGADDDSPKGESGAAIELEVWYTFSPESLEEEVFLTSISNFTEQTGIQVEATRVSYGDADQLFITAAQGGEAPDLLRISSDSLGKFGEIRVDGQPLFEDLRPHLTPIERSRYDPTSLDSMRYGDSLYAIPASFDCLSLKFTSQVLYE